MIYRSNREDNGEQIYGSLMQIEVGYFIIPIDATLQDRSYGTKPQDCGIFEYEKITPETLAMETTICDKDGKMIFGSIPIKDGKMSEGGDEVKLYTGYWTGWQNGKVTWQSEGSVGWCIVLAEEKGRLGLNTSDVVEIINPDNPQAEQRKG